MMLILMNIWTVLKDFVKKKKKKKLKKIKLKNKWALNKKKKKKKLENKRYISMME